MSGEQTWVGGPLHEVRNQHIPGYAGHIYHLKAENQFSKSFATITNRCVDDLVEKGFEQSAKERFQTMNHQEFGKPRVLADTAIKIIQTQKQDTYQAPIDRVPVVGYQGYRPKYRHPIKQVVQPEIIQMSQTQQQRDVVPVVGYTGYIPKIKATNMYAKSYNDHCKQSIFY